jgi:divalent metal cation (Fe/Co/Zn/Cd) transporter
MDGSMNLRQAHKVSDEVEDILMEAFPDADIIIHQDPEGLERLTMLEKG